MTHASAQIQRGIGDALVTFESEVELIKAEFDAHFELVHQKRTILAGNPAAAVDHVVDRRPTRKEAEAWLQWLDSDDGREIAATHRQ